MVALRGGLFLMCEVPLYHIIDHTIPYYAERLDSNQVYDALAGCEGSPAPEVKDADAQGTAPSRPCHTVRPDCSTVQELLSSTRLLDDLRTTTS